MNQSPAQTTALSVPLSRSASNFAPAKPLQDFLQSKRLNKNATRFEESIRQWISTKLNHEKAAWDEMISMAQLVALFRKGNQLLQRRRYGLGYYVRPVQQDDTAIRQTAMNLMAFHAQVCESKIIASNPSVNMRAGDETPEAIAAAQACRPVVDYYESEWYTAKFSRREAIRFLTDGIVIHQVRWNPFLGGYQVAERQVSSKEVTTYEGGGECLDCSFQGEAEEFADDLCPQCQSPALDVRQPIHQSIPQISMGQSRPVGEPEIISSPFAAWRWDLTRDLELSSWAIKRQYVSLGAIKLLVGDKSIPASQSEDQFGLEAMKALAYSGQAFAGDSRTSNYRSNPDSQPVLTECWLSPEDQAEIEYESYQTVEGQQVPAGRLSDVCGGQSCCLLALNDGALIVGGYMGESHQDQVVTAQWFMDADSGGGRGMEDTAAVQRRFNAVDGQIYQGLANTATPSVFTDMRLIREDQGRYLFTPGQNVDIDLSLLPPNLGLKDAIFVGAPGAVSQQYIQYGSNFLMQMASMSSLITELSIGSGGNLLSVDNRTATGAQITAALANSLYGPMLMSKGQSRVEIAKKIAQLVAKHSVGGRYYPGKGAAKGRMVDCAELKNGRVIFDLVQNSQLPVTPFSQQTDVRVLIESFQGVPNLIALRQGDLGMFKALTRPFNVPLDIETEDDVSNLCLGRLEQMKGNLAAGIIDPKELVASIRPVPRQTEPKHKEKAAWWSAWLDLQSSQEAPEELRQAAENMYWLHMNFDAQRQIPEALNQGMVQAAQMAPAAMGQAALQPQEQSAPEKDDGAKIEADLQQTQMDNENDLRLKQMESETQLQQSQIQGEYMLENTKLAGKNQVAAARARPKPQPAAGKSA